MIPINPFQRRHPDLKGKSLSSVEKEWIMHKTTCPDMSVSNVAIRYNLSRQVIYKWLKNKKEGKTLHDQNGRPPVLNKDSIKKLIIEIDKSEA